MNANEPAFPLITEYRDSRGETLPGLTKRELFAAMIYQGMSSISDPMDARKISASLAVECADALLAALSKVETKGTTTSKGDVEK